MLYLTLRHYEYIAAVARHGSLSAAADVLHVSQPALSTALSRIEQHLDQALFLRRRGAPLVLTPQGRDFATRAQTLLDQAANLENLTSALPSAQRISLGCFTDLAPFLLAPALQALRTALPEVQVDYIANPFDPLITALSKSEIDLAISYDLGLDANYTRYELGQITPHALVSPDHPIALQPTVTLAELASVPLVLSQEGLSVQHMLSLFKSRDLAPTIAHRAASLELLRSLTANGHGVGISYSLPPGNLSYDGKEICAVPIAETDIAEPIVLISHAQPSNGSTLANALTALTQNLPNHL